MPSTLLTIECKVTSKYIASINAMKLQDLSEWEVTNYVAAFMDIL